jgi:hypothetical protein
MLAIPVRIAVRAPMLLCRDPVDPWSNLHLPTIPFPNHTLVQRTLPHDFSNQVPAPRTIIELVTFDVAVSDSHDDSVNGNSLLREQ